MISSAEVKNTVNEIRKIEWIEMLQKISPQIKNIHCENNQILHANFKSLKISITISYTTVFLMIKTDNFEKSYLQPKCYDLIGKLNTCTASGCHILLEDNSGCMYGFKNSIPYFREENIPATIEKCLSRSIKSAAKAVDLLKKNMEETITPKDIKAYETIWKN